MPDYNVAPAIERAMMIAAYYHKNMAWRGCEHFATAMRIDAALREMKNKKKVRAEIHNENTI
jgi:hypothetical protein